MTEQTSLFELIKSNLENGTLKKGFSLPSLQQENLPRFADGAMDGILIYHTKPYETEEADFELIGQALAAAGEGDRETTDRLFAELGAKVPAAQMVDAFQMYIQENAEGLDIGKIYPCIFDVVCRSSHRESIKYCLEMMELLDTEHEFIQNVVRVLALSDEFTLYAAWIMRSWKNGNEEIFDLAKKVRGWGRIHAVEQLQPETDEIRDWLLTEGTRNDILPAYSALTCWEKSEAEQRLSGKLSDREYRGILTLLEALMDEGPISGISNLERPDQLAASVVNRGEQYSLTLEDYETVYSFLIWAERETAPKLLTARACRSLLLSEACKIAVERADGAGVQTPLKKLYQQET